MITAAIVGATGYTGLELLRLLSVHSNLTVTHLYSRSVAGQSVGSVYPHLTAAYPGLVYESFDTDAISQCDADVLFLALPHGTTHSVMDQWISSGKLILDLSADFRLKSVDQYAKYYRISHQSATLLETSVYGLPELHREALAGKTLCAVPGCYATTIILGLFPACQNGLITGPIIADAKSGVTGAGKTAKEAFMYSEINENFSAYNTGIHRHTAELEQELGVPVFFSPHLVPMNRGILASIYVHFADGVTFEQFVSDYETFYADQPFVRINQSIDTPNTRYVSGTNECVITIKPMGHTGAVIFSAVDNLIKGASGQAIQCLNIIKGWDETLGLPKSADWI